MGLILGAEFVVTVGDICAFSSAERLAAYAGDWYPHRVTLGQAGRQAPLSRRGGNKTLKRVFYQSAFASLRTSPHSLGPSTSARGL